MQAAIPGPPHGCLLVPSAKAKSARALQRPSPQSQGTHLPQGLGLGSSLLGPFLPLNLVFKGQLLRVSKRDFCRITTPTSSSSANSVILLYVFSGPCGFFIVLATHSDTYPLA